MTHWIIESVQIKEWSLLSGIQSGQWQMMLKSLVLHALQIWVDLHSLHSLTLLRRPQRIQKSNKFTIWSLVFDNSNDCFSHFQALFGLSERADSQCHNPFSALLHRSTYGCKSLYFSPKTMSLESAVEEPLLQACLFFVRMSLVRETKHLGTFCGRGNKGNGVGRAARKMCVRLLLAEFKSIFKVEHHEAG